MKELPIQLFSAADKDPAQFTFDGFKTVPLTVQMIIQ